MSHASPGASNPQIEVTVDFAAPSRLDSGSDGCVASVDLGIFPQYPRQHG
jgi:hypothetical protein